MNGITAEIKTSLFTGWSVGQNPAGAASELFILRTPNLAKPRGRNCEQEPTIPTQINSRRESISSRLRKAIRSFVTAPINVETL